MYTHIIYTYIYLYSYIYIYIYIYIYTHICTYTHYYTMLHYTILYVCYYTYVTYPTPPRFTPSPPTKSFEFRGFDSSKLLILKGGNSSVRGLS